jgi:hypothetical protein
MCTSNMTELLLIFHVKLVIFIIIFLGDRSGVRLPIVGQQGLQALAHRFLVWGWVKESV